VPVSKQRNRRKENAEIKEGKVPEAWQDHPNDQGKRIWQVSQENGVSHYGYKDSISVAVVYGLIRRPVLPPAEYPRQSDASPALLDVEHEEALMWADAAYQSTLVDSFLKEAGHEGRIQETHPLNTGAKGRNREHARTRAKVEHVFG